jgi:hypothetical protein
MGESLVGATPKGNSELKNCRGNPLWLPKIMGRHVERSNVYYTGPAPTKDFSIPKSEILIGGCPKSGKVDINPKM